MQRFNTIIINTAFEDSDQAIVLDKMTFTEFKEQLKFWMKNIKMLWYISGNYKVEDAKKLVQDSIDKFVLEEAPEIEDLAPTCVAKLKPKVAYLIEQELKDPKNGNSCAMIYYQSSIVSRSDPNHKDKLMNDMVMHHIKEPIFSELRTK